MNKMLIIMVTFVTEVTLNQIANLRKKKTFQDTLVILVTMVTLATILILALFNNPINTGNYGNLGNSSSFFGHS